MLIVYSDGIYGSWVMLLRWTTQNHILILVKKGVQKCFTYVVKVVCLFVGAPGNEGRPGDSGVPGSQGYFGAKGAPGQIGRSGLIGERQRLSDEADFELFPSKQHNHA